MNAERFKAIVEAYGADEKRWPEAERSAAMAFAARPEAQKLLAEARALDALLDASEDTEPVSLGFVRSAISAAPANLAFARGGMSASARAPVRQPLSWRPLAALAACAVFGLVLGLGGARSVVEEDAAAVAFEIAFGGGGIG
ncbi:MAG: hypothetical protein NW206_07855 [Hyphomonadaceae bacterium]|nr:hypothetical protein [Hyphomonadaceae bacterium]